MESEMSVLSNQQLNFKNQELKIRELDLLDSTKLNAVFSDYQDFLSENLEVPDIIFDQSDIKGLKHLYQFQQRNKEPLVMLEPKEELEPPKSRYYIL